MIVIQDDNQNRDNEIAAIFNPKRVRTPSVVVTNDSPNGPPSLGAATATTTHFPPITHSDSVTSSQHDGAESLTGVIIHGDNIDLHSHHQPHSLTQIHPTQLPRSASAEKPKGCRGSCCSGFAQKTYFGVCVTIFITFCWVAGTHCLYFLFLPSTSLHHSLSSSMRGSYSSSSGSDDNASHYDPLPLHKVASVPAGAMPMSFSPQQSSSGVAAASMTTTTQDFLGLYSAEGSGGDVEEAAAATTITSPSKAKTNENEDLQFKAPFFASWFCMNFSILFFPLFLILRGCASKCGENNETIGDIFQSFRERGYTVGRYLYRCVTFCILFVLAMFFYMKSLKYPLYSTDVIVLFATNVAPTYLLSWVILHEQFVGVRIVAVILVDTGIALLAYMNGISESRTLRSVVWAVLSGAGYAVFRVLFRKMIGDQQPSARIAFTFTVMGIMNAVLLWPICFVIYMTGAETIPWDPLIIALILIASFLLFVFHFLTLLGSSVTYNMFVTLGLITSVPVSGFLDVLFYEAKFSEMELGGIILVSTGFFLVMFPNNWPDYITRLLRKTGRYILRHQCCCEFAEFASDYPDHSKYRLVRTQCEMGAFKKRPSQLIHWSHRLSDGLHSLQPQIAIRKGQIANEMFTGSNFDLSNYYVPPLTNSNRSSVCETNFIGLGLRVKHRESYASLDSTLNKLY